MCGRHALSIVPLVKSPNTHYVGGWMGPRARVDGIGETPPPGFELRTVQSVASPSTDHAIPPPLSGGHRGFFFRK